MSENLCRICARIIKVNSALQLFNSENKILLLKIKDLTGVEVSCEIRIILNEVNNKLVCYAS